MMSQRRLASSLVLSICVVAAVVSAPMAGADRGGAETAASVLASTERHRPLGSGARHPSRDSTLTEAVTLDRLAGMNRYTTAVAVSRAHFPDGTWPADPNHPGQPGDPVRFVVVASGENYPDALGGGPLAAGIGPLLLVPSSGTIPSEVTTEIRRLAPDHIFILGGSGAVDSGVEAQLKAQADIVRFDGADRYDTASWVAAYASDDLEGAETIVLASGESFADALPGGAAAANQSGVLLLTRARSLPPQTQWALERIDPQVVEVLGGPSVISDEVMNAVRSAVPSSVVTRVAGADRAATAAELSRVTFPEGTQETFFANGWTYPDALAAAPLSWFWGTPVLMSRTGCAPAATITEDARLAPIYRTAIGGTGAVSDAALNLKKC